MGKYLLISEEQRGIVSVDKVSLPPSLPPLSLSLSPSATRIFMGAAACAGRRARMRCGYNPQKRPQEPRQHRCCSRCSSCFDSCQKWSWPAFPPCSAQSSPRTAAAMAAHGDHTRNPLSLLLTQPSHTRLPQHIGAPVLADSAAWGSFLRQWQCWKWSHLLSCTTPMVV